MVQHDFSAPKEAISSKAASPTAALDQFLDYQNQSYFEELYKSEAVCLCILRYVPPEMIRQGTNQKTTTARGAPDRPTYLMVSPTITFRRRQGNVSTPIEWSNQCVRRLEEGRKRKGD